MSCIQIKKDPNRLIDITNSEAFLIRRDGDAGDILNVNTINPADAGAGVNTLNIEVGGAGGFHTGSANGSIALRVFNRINTGTQSKYLRASHFQVTNSGDASFTGSFAQAMRAFHMAAVHDSTGTLTNMHGMRLSTSVLATGSAITAGLVDSAICLVIDPSFGTSGQCSVTDWHHIKLNTPSGTSAGSSRTVTNLFGIEIEDMGNLDGVTTSYAIKTGTGDVQFGDTVTIDQNSDLNALNIDSEATTLALINLQSPAITTGNTIRFADCNALTTGRVLLCHSNSADTSVRNLVTFHNDHTSATQTTVLDVVQDAAFRAMAITHSGASETGLLIDRDSNHANDIYALTIQSDNAGGGNPGGIDMATFSAGEPVMACPTDNTDPTGGGGAAAGRIAISIGGVVKYIPYY